MSKPRILCRAFLVAGALAVATAAHDAEAATARVRWRPSVTGPVLGYEIYVRDGGAPYRVDPQWSGNPTPAADGSLSALVPFTPAAMGPSWVALVAVNAAGDSALSDEFPIGTPDPCRQDRCTSKTGCDFSPRTDGTPCGDGSLCNGSETCLSGACTARDCGDVACSAGVPATAVTLDRIRLARRQSGVTLAAKGRFTADPALNPSVTGAVLELHGPDGAPLHAATIAPSAFAVKASGRRFVFRPTDEAADPLWNGLERLELRRKDATWRVSYKAATPELMTAALEPALTWVIRLGATCAESGAASCDQRSITSICR